MSSLYERTSLHRGYLYFVEILNKVCITIPGSYLVYFVRLQSAISIARAVLKSSSKVTLLMKELLKRSIILVLIIVQNIPPPLSLVCYGYLVSWYVVQACVIDLLKRFKAAIRKSWKSRPEINIGGNFNK